MTQKVEVLYHSNCLDGMMSAAIVYKYLTEELKLPKDELRFLPVKYQENPPILRPDSKVYIVDFSYPREVILDLQSRHELIIYDHHKTALEQLLGIKGALFDMNESGATLTWKQLFPNQPVPFAVQMIRDRDLWLWKMPRTKAFTEALYNLEDMEVERWQSLFNDTYVFDLINKGDAIVAASNKQIERQLQNIYWAKLPLHDEVIPMINSGHLISETCQAMYTKFPDAPYVAMWTLKDDKVYVSLRSSPTGADVSEVAKMYSGGGHRSASGFTSTVKQWFKSK